ncbi:hypothetical protein K439DRAFT_1621213 [Ramaria rubella]|nr:hypothetical protein K439DRAFT_1621213 [Ramaria rubella]
MDVSYSDVVNASAHAAWLLMGVIWDQRVMLKRRVAILDHKDARDGLVSTIGSVSMRCAPWGVDKYGCEAGAEAGMDVMEAEEIRVPGMRCGDACGPEGVRKEWECERNVLVRHCDTAHNDDIPQHSPRTPSLVTAYVCAALQRAVVEDRGCQSVKVYQCTITIIDTRFREPTPRPSVHIHHNACSTSFPAATCSSRSHLQVQAK